MAAAEEAVNSAFGARSTTEWKKAASATGLDTLTEVEIAGTYDDNVGSNGEFQWPLRPLTQVRELPK